MLPASMNALIAFFYSGIFWMMVWFVVENRRAPRDQQKPLVPLALVLMVLSIYLMHGVVSRGSMFAVPFDAPIAAAAFDHAK